MRPPWEIITDDVDEKIAPLQEVPVEVINRTMSSVHEMAKKVALRNLDLNSPESKELRAEFTGEKITRWKHFVWKVQWAWLRFKNRWL
jgi:hypothetical protein